MSRKNFYKNRKIEKRINFKNIKLIAFFIIISLGMNQINYDHIDILKDNIVLDFLKSPLNIIAIISLFNPIVIFENKMDLEENISSQIIRLREKEKLDLESVREAVK